MLILLMTLLTTDGYTAPAAQNCVQNKGGSADASVDEFCKEVKALVVGGADCKQKLVVGSLRAINGMVWRNGNGVKACETSMGCLRQEMWTLVEEISKAVRFGNAPLYKGHAEKSFEKCNGVSACELREIGNSFFRAQDLFGVDIKKVEKPDLSQAKDETAVLAAFAPEVFRLHGQILVRGKETVEKLNKQFAECGK